MITLMVERARSMRKSMTQQPISLAPKGLSGPKPPSRAAGLAGYLARAQWGWEDLDSDGDLDIAVAVNSSPGRLFWYQNPGGADASNPALWHEYLIDATPGDGADAQIGDIDQDGNPDIVYSGNRGTLNYLYAYFAPADPTNVPGWTRVSLAGDTYHASLVDFDGDGDLDIIRASAYSNLVSWLENPGGAAARSLTNWHEYVIEQNASITTANRASVADIDGDGDLDIGMDADPSGSTGIFKWYRRPDDPRDVGAWQIYTIDSDPTYTAYAHDSFLADIDLDGDVDMAGVGPNSKTVMWWVNEPAAGGTTYLDPTKWQNGGGNVDNSIVTVTGPNTYIRSQPTFLYKAIRTKARFAVYANYGDIGFNSGLLTLGKNDAAFTSWDGVIRSITSDANSFSWGYSLDEGTDWKTWDLLWNPGQVKFLVDGVLRQVHSTTIPSIPLNLQMNTYEGNPNLQADWVLVREYVTSEPTASVGIEEAQNTAPLAADDNYSTNEDTVLHVAAPGVLDNDTDADLDPLSAVKVTDPAHGAVTLNADGSFTYTPETGFSGEDSFTYKANDGTTDSNEATVTITVEATHLCVNVGGTDGCYAGIQAAIDAATQGDTISVYPGTYDQDEANGRDPDTGGSGANDFNIFVDKGLTLQGVDGSGDPITSSAGVLAQVIAKRDLPSFGEDAIFVQADHVTITGLKIVGRVTENNKTIEVVGDDFVLKDSQVYAMDGVAAVYMDDRHYDAGTDTSHVQAYLIDGNLLDGGGLFGSGLRFSSGAGWSGPVSGRVISNNTFQAVLDGIEFVGPQADPWDVYPVGAATITGNNFTAADRRHIIAWGTYAGGLGYGALDWNDILSSNTFDKAVTVRTPADEMRTWDCPGCGSAGDILNIVGIYSGIQRYAIDRVAQAGDTINVGAGTYAERVVVDKPLTLSGAGVGSSILDASSFSTAGNVINITALTGDTKIEGFDLLTGDFSNGIHAAGGTDAAGKIEILNNHIISTDFGDDQYGIIGGYGDVRKVVISGTKSPTPTPTAS